MVFPGILNPAAGEGSGVGEPAKSGALPGKEEVQGVATHRKPRAKRRGTPRQIRLASRRAALPAETVRLVEALCADYPRREKALREESERAEVLRQYRFLNSAIREALLTVVKEEDLALLLTDIAERRSRTRSPQYRLHPTTYADVKRRAKFAVARRLRLI